VGTILSDCLYLLPLIISDCLYLLPLIIPDCLSLQRAGTIISMSSRLEDAEISGSNAPVGAEGTGSSAAAPPPPQEVVTDAVCVVPEPQGASIAL
jgi:hypothetical protein